MPSVTLTLGEFLDAAKPCLEVATKNGSLPVLSCLRFHADGIGATDLERSVWSACPIGLEAVPGTQIRHVVEALDVFRTTCGYTCTAGYFVKSKEWRAYPVTITVVPCDDPLNEYHRERMSFACQAYEASILTMPVDEFPALPLDRLPNREGVWYWYRPKMEGGKGQWERENRTPKKHTSKRRRTNVWTEAQVNATVASGELLPDGIVTPDGIDTSQWFERTPARFMEIGGTEARHRELWRTQVVKGATFWNEWQDADIRKGIARIPYNDLRALAEERIMNAKVAHVLNKATYVLKSVQSAYEHGDLVAAEGHAFASDYYKDEVATVLKLVEDLGLIQDDMTTGVQDWPEAPAAVPPPIPVAEPATLTYKVGYNRDWTWVTMTGANNGEADRLRKADFWKSTKRSVGPVEAWFAKRIVPEADVATIIG